MYKIKFSHEAIRPSGVSEARDYLSQEQREGLLKILKEHENPYVREKILILLLMNDGKTYDALDQKTFEYMIAAIAVLKEKK